MSDTIDDLLDAEPFTATDYANERSVLLEAFSAIGLALGDVELKVKAHDYEHGTRDGDLCDRWLENELWRPYLKLDVHGSDRAVQ